MAVGLQWDRVADELFPDLKLGDVRRDRRFRRVVDTIAHNSGASLPCRFPNPSDSHAGRDLFETPRKHPRRDSRRASTRRPTRPAGPNAKNSSNTTNP